MKPLILAVSLAVAGTVLYLVLQVRKIEGPVKPIPTLSATTHPDLATLAPVPRLRQRPTAPTDEDKTGAPKVDVAEDRAVSESALTGEEVRDHIETSFGADHALASSHDLAQGLEDGVRAVLPAGSSVRSVECRSALCRIETVHPSVDEFRDFVARAFLAPDAKVASGPVFAGLLTEPARGEAVVAVAYVGRDGSPLPMPTRRAR
jgi:hypothetical protein